MLYLTLMSSWKVTKFAREYAQNSSDTNKNWYEHEVNFPSLLGMVPASARRVLDYVCGPGDFTCKLAEKYPTVDGCDYSDAMINLARSRYPDCAFFVWEDPHTVPDVGPYDVIFSKMTLQFVDDLFALAHTMSALLVNEGMVVFSVPHPFVSLTKVKDYWSVIPYEQLTGTYGMSTTMIHRSVGDYIVPFIHNGYTLVDIVEPHITHQQVVEHNESEVKAANPRRLNLSFRKVHASG